MSAVDGARREARREARRPLLVVLGVFALRSCLPAKRRAALLMPCVGTVLFGLLSLAGDDRERVFANIAAEGILSLMVPIAALIVGDAMLGAEVRAGTFHFTFLSPVPAGTIVVARWVAGSLAIVAAVVPATVLAALVAGSPDAAWPLAVAAATGGVAYVAVFVAIGCITRRTAVWSLAIVFLVERLLGAALTGIAQLSPTWESRAIFVDWLGDAPDRLVRDGIPAGGAAIVRLAIVTVIMLGVATWRLRHLRLSGAAD